MLTSPSHSFPLPARYQALSDHLIDGGFGTVKKVRDTFLDRDVLLKYMQDAANNTQLINEIQGLSKARSRHVVEIYDVIKDSHGLVIGIIIELLTGRGYEAYHTEWRANPMEYLRILYQISTALADLHQAGIVHRDLKLANLKQSASGLLKIFDFGLASDNTDYQTLANRGTLVYAAPELFVPGAVITKEMDVYAFGICAWMLASPVQPPELYERPPQKTGGAFSISTVIGTELPREIAQLIDACIHPDPASRPVARDVSAFLSKYLVKGKHRGLFVQGLAKVYELTASTPKVNIKIGTLGEIRIQYDGLSFQIVAVSGDVFINNFVAEINAVLPDSCVLTFGLSGPGRQFVAFSSSHPGVVL